jgi:ABC-type Na+ efflux pump permease subunit
MIIQAGQHNLHIRSVPVQVNPKTRPSRLFKSMSAYMRRSMATILRIYTLYSPLKVFTILAAIPFFLGFALAIRFLAFYIGGEGAGHIQSLIFAAVLFNLSFVFFMLGVLADLIGFNRRLLEQLLTRSRHKVQ